MVRLNAFVALAVVCGSLCAAPADSPFPVPPPQPVAPPTPAPSGTVLNLAADSLYIVNSTKDGALRIHPAGLVTISKETGPLTIKGKFADGGGKSETRKYAGPFVFIVEPVAGAKGRIELDFIPYKFEKDAEISTATVDVNGGQAPQPPPVDPVTPVVPVAPIDPLTTALQTAYNGERDAAKLKILTDIMAGVVSAAKASGAVTTTKQLQDKVHQATDLAVGVGQLPATRKAIGAYLITKLGTANVPLNLVSWNAADNAYAAVAVALKGIK